MSLQPFQTSFLEISIFGLYVTQAEKPTASFRELQGPKIANKLAKETTDFGLAFKKKGDCSFSLIRTSI